jgi:hypothetical protein
MVYRPPRPSHAKQVTACLRRWPGPRCLLTTSCRLRSTDHARPGVNGFGGAGGYAGANGYATHHPADGGYGAPPPAYPTYSGYELRAQPYQQQNVPVPGAANGGYAYRQGMPGLQDPAIVYSSGPKHGGSEGGVHLRPCS